MMILAEMRRFSTGRAWSVGAGRVAGALVVATLALGACSGSDPELNPSDDGGSLSADGAAATVDDYIRGLSQLQRDPPNKEDGTEGASEPDGDYVCVKRSREETRSYDSIVAYAANSNALWPGALIRGDSVYEGLFAPIAIQRAPATISVSLENLDGNKSAQIASPSLSSFREAIGGILAANVTGATAANIYSEIEVVHSEEQLALAMGAEVSWPGDLVSIKSSFDFNDTSSRSRLVVRFIQAYYTVDVDPPGKPSAFLADDVTLDDLEPVMGAGNPPLYVSSVTYGRMVVFTVESQYSAEEMQGALDFAYRGATELSGDVSLTYKEMLSSSKITAYILGGSGADATRSIQDFDALKAFIEAGGNYSKDSPGAPIAYKLAHLSDNTPARLSFTSEYDVTDCSRVTQRVRVVLEGIRVDDAGGDSGGDLEVFGTIRATGNDTAFVFSKDEEQAVKIAVGETWPGGAAGDRVVPVTPEAGKSINLKALLSDADGLTKSDIICDTLAPAAFESGWRRDVELQCTGDGAKLTLLLRLDPI